METRDLKSQPGPQEVFLACDADIAIYGGAAGGGKTYALLLEAMRHTDKPDFGCVIFRRETPQITNEGALWDESEKIYGGLAKPRERRIWGFPSGAQIQFSHLEHEDDRLNWQGSQIAMIGFDELTHFTAKQFWYLVSRNRSVSAVRPYIRATCNPDPDSFVAELISWWIDQETGYPIPERAGVTRYFVRLNDTIHWAGTSQELERRYPAACFEEVDGQKLRTGPKSLCFIPSKVTDNVALMRNDPGYLANLRSLPEVERERLERGNWKIRDERTVIYKPSWWMHWAKEKRGAKLPDVHHVFASWDTAFTAQEQRLTGAKRPDLDKIAFSACTVWGIWFDDADIGPGRDTGTYKLLMLAAWWGRVDWPDLRAKVTEIEKKYLTHKEDAHLIEKAASGRSLIDDLRRARRTVRCRVIGVQPTRGDGKMDAKVLRAYLGQTYHKDGYLWVPDRPWVPEVVSWLGAFPGGSPPSADLADTVSMAIQHLKQRWWIHHPDDEIEDQEPSPLTDEDKEDVSPKAAVGYG